MSHKEMTAQKSSSLTAWNPLREFRALTGIPDLFEDLFQGFPMMRLAAPVQGWTAKVNIKETDKEYVITAAVPGVKKEDLKISFQDGVLTISGERKEEKEEKGKGYLRQEISCGSFSRSFVLPSGMHPEDVKASQKDGVLTVTLPKREPAKSRGVNIKVD